MQIQFNKQMLHLQVICGILENFKPTKEIKDLHKKLEKVQKQTDKFQKEILFPVLEEIEKKVIAINEANAEKGRTPSKTEEPKAESKS